MKRTNSKGMRNGLMLTGLLGLAMMGRADAARISVDSGNAYQPIDGFGAFLNNSFDEQKASLLGQDMGGTIARTSIPPDLEPARGNYQWSAPDVVQQLTWMREAAAAGVDKIFTTAWSPPYWMKTNGSCCGGSIDPAKYEDYADFLVQWVKGIKERTGVEIYAVSIQNEPAFAEPYDSDLQYPDTYRKIYRIVHDKFKAAGLKTRLLGPEDIGDAARLAEYVQSIEEEPGQAGSLDIFAEHGYGSTGINPSGNSLAYYLRVKELAERNHARHWQTETSGFSNDWPGALSMAVNIYDYLTVADASAWVFWEFTDDVPSRINQSLLLGDEPTQRYYALKQFARFMRPGDRRIEAVSDDPDVDVVASRHQAGAGAIVAINVADSAKVAEVDVLGCPKQAHWQIWQSTSVRNCAHVGDLQGGRLQVTLPPQSITTLYSMGYREKAVRPVIRRQPEKQEVEEGAPLLLRVDAAGTSRMHYQWYVGNREVTAATAATLKVDQATLADAGSYWVKVWNDAGAVNSAGALVRVTSYTGSRIVKASKSPLIDGKIDSVWAPAQKQNIGKVLSGSPSPYFSAWYKAMWNESGLYLLVSVADKTPSCSHANLNEGYQNDSVEVYLDVDGDKELTFDANDFHFLRSRSIDHLWEGTNWDEGKGVPGCRVAHVETPTGYVNEYMFPWKSLGTRAPATGTFIGLDIMADDAVNGSRRAKIAWHATEDRTWDIPANMATVRLAP